MPWRCAVVGMNRVNERSMNQIDEAPINLPPLSERLEFWLEKLTPNANRHGLVEAIENHTRAAVLADRAGREDAAPVQQEQSPCCEVCGYIKARCACGTYTHPSTDLRAELAECQQKLRAVLHDYHNGTPCEQIAWAHERESLLALLRDVQSWFSCYDNTLVAEQIRQRIDASSRALNAARRRSMMLGFAIASAKKNTTRHEKGN